jgi:hypothetical protein
MLCSVASAKKVWRPERIAVGMNGDLPTSLCFTRWTFFAWLRLYICWTTSFAFCSSYRASTPTVCTPPLRAKDYTPPPPQSACPGPAALRYNTNLSNRYVSSAIVARPLYATPSHKASITTGHIRPCLIRYDRSAVLYNTQSLGDYRPYPVRGQGPRSASRKSGTCSDGETRVFRR